MGKLFEELDYQETPMGDLILRRRVVAMLNDQEVFEVTLAEDFLMSSMFHVVEDAVSHLGLAEVEAEECDVVVGGLGLGYTAAAGLEHKKVRSMLVVDALEPVISWHQRGLVPMGPILTADPRCQLVHGDFFALARSKEGFAQGRKFHAVLLDIDHSPQDFLHPSHESFYSPAGLSSLAGHLHPGGAFAMWSDNPPDDGFLGLLKAEFASARAEVVTFPNPLLDRESASTVYVARKAGVAEHQG